MFEGECENADDGLDSENSPAVLLEDGLAPNEIETLKDALLRAGLPDSPVNRNLMVNAYRFALSTDPVSSIRSGFAPEYVRSFAAAVEAGTELRRFVPDIYTWAGMRG